MFKSFYTNFLDYFYCSSFIFKKILSTLMLERIGTSKRKVTSTGEQKWSKHYFISVCKKITRLKFLTISLQFYLLLGFGQHSTCLYMFFSVSLISLRTAESNVEQTGMPTPGQIRKPARNKGFKKILSLCRIMERITLELKVQL